MIIPKLRATREELGFGSQQTQGPAWEMHSVLRPHSPKEPELFSGHRVLTPGTTLRHWLTLQAVKGRDSQMHFFWWGKLPASGVRELKGDQYQNPESYSFLIHMMGKEKKC